MQHACRYIYKYAIFLEELDQFSLVSDIYEMFNRPIDGTTRLVFTTDPMSKEWKLSFIVEIKNIVEVPYS